MNDILTQIGKMLTEHAVNAEAEQAVTDIINQIAKQVALGREAAINCKDPNIRQEILDYCEELEGLIPPIVTAIREAFADPTSKPAQQRLVTQSTINDQLANE